MKTLLVAILLFAPAVFAQANSTPGPATDPWKALQFLEGTWEANTQGGSAGAQGSATYIFQWELGHHILARHSTNASGCKGPVTFNCEHGDLLYIYQDSVGAPLRAIYFDNEGHVIHYDVSAPSPTTALLISDAPPSGPQFRLIYELHGAIMSGKFQMRMPSQSNWKSYLEWAGARLRDAH